MKTRKRALVIAPQPFFSPRGTPFSVYYRTMVTAEMGVHIDFLTYGEGQDVDLPNVTIVRIPRFAGLGNVKIGPSGLKLFLDIFIILYTLGLLCRHRYDFVHAHEESIFFCRFLKPLFRFKLVYDMHSSLPQQLTNFEFTTSRLLIGLFKKLEDTCIRNADAVITICPDLADYVDTIIPDKSRHFLIENSIFDPVQLKGASPAAQSTSGCPDILPRDRQLIVYAGTLEPYQGIDILIEGFALAVKTHPKAFLLVAGGTDAQVAEYRSLAERLGICRDCLFTGRVPQANAKEYSARASVLVSPRKSGTNTPLKIYEQLASGIPLVATKIYSHTQVLTPDVAILVEPDAQGMATGLIDALSPEGGRVVAGAMALYEQKYSRAAYEQKMRQLMERLA